MPPAQLVGREGCVNMLATRLVNGSNTAVPGPRKAGKTSACRAAMALAARAPHILPVELDLYEVEDEDGFLDAVHDAVVASVAARAKPAVSAAGRLVPRLARLGFDVLAEEAGLGEILKLPAKGAARTEATLRLPQELAQARHARTAFLIDEAQRMSMFSERFKRSIHAALRDSDKVTLLVTGGDGEQMDELFLDPLGPIADLISHQHVLTSVSDDEWHAGLRRLFALDECTIDDRAIELIIEEGKRIGVTPIHSTIAIAHHVHLLARLDDTTQITAGLGLRGFEAAANDLVRLAARGPISV